MCTLLNKIHYTCTTDTDLYYLPAFIFDVVSLSYLESGNTKGGSITVPLTPCLTGLELALWQLTIFVFICKADQFTPVKQEVNGTVIPLKYSLLESSRTSENLIEYYRMFYKSLEWNVSRDGVTFALKDKERILLLASYQRYLLI